MKSFKRLFILGIISCVFGFGTARALPDISALVQLDQNTYLIVRDLKHPRDPGPRIGVLTVSFGSPSPLRNQELEIQSWPKSEPPPSDLEAACAVPGSGNFYLLAESGYYKGRFGRLFLLRIRKIGPDSWRARYIRSFVPFPPPSGTNAPFTTPGWNQIEGMACFRTNPHQTLVLFAHRGGARNGRTAPPHLSWGTLSLSEPYSFRQAGTFSLPETPSHWRCNRGCTSLFLDPVSPRTFRVICSAAMDRGDFGPFRSVIHEAGILRWDGKESLRFTPQLPTPLYILEGTKVEAMAPCPESIPPTKICIGSDDERYGGLWRPLFSMPKASSPEIR